ncbi:MAG: HlyD family efflux transporter periplasmic adaptor subunit [Chitinophagaceae bacterium]|nr:HlyD family efflux transporter periplasmic adaptor subunit [Chitinophagaceae bacterium]
MNKSLISIAASILILTGCKSSGSNADASGTFEATEVIVSAQANGRILSLDIDEGTILPADTIVGQVDPSDLSLQKEQVEASISSLNDQTQNAAPNVKLLQNQVAVQQSQLNNLLHEKGRIENLLKQDAATGKQLDDINAQIDLVKKQMDVTRQQINVQLNNVNTQNNAVLSNAKPLQKKAALLDDQMKKASILNPVQGTVLVKYAEKGEITSMGKALYKIADLTTLDLRAYPTAAQLSNIKLNQSVKVLVDDGSKKYREYSGTIIWISDKAEFTPKTIQTKEERANLVYAIKIKVKNDGFLKIGMYGEVKF